MLRRYSSLSSGVHNPVNRKRDFTSYTDEDQFFLKYCNKKSHMHFLQSLNFIHTVWKMILVSQRRRDWYHVLFSQTTALRCTFMISPLEFGWMYPLDKIAATLPHLLVFESFLKFMPLWGSWEMPRALQGGGSPRQRGSRGCQVLGACMWRLDYA